MSVFADTSGLYALLVRTEERHADVVRAFRALVEGGRGIATTNYVLLETTALLQHRLGLEPVRDFDQRVLPLLAVRWVTESLHRRAMKRLSREDRRSLSLVDCVSFELMDSEGLRDALALDRHFADEGFRLTPSARR